MSIYEHPRGGRRRPRIIRGGLVPCPRCGGPIAPADAGRCWWCAEVRHEKKGGLALRRRPNLGGAA